MVEREKIKLILTRIPGIENSRYALGGRSSANADHREQPLRLDNSDDEEDISEAAVYSVAICKSAL